MKVLVASPTAFSNMAGLYEFNLCRKLTDKGIDVSSIALSGDNSAYCRNSKIVPKLGLFSSRISTNQLYSPFIQKILVESSPNIVHLNSALWSFLPLQISLINKFLMKNRFATVLTTHAFYPDHQKNLKGSVINSIKQSSPTDLLFWSRSIALNYVHKVICMSNLEKEYLSEQIGLSSNKIEVIPNAINLDRFQTETYDFAKRFNIHADYILLYVGQVIPLKGIYYLLTALKMLRASGLDCKLLILTYNLQEDIRSYATILGVNNHVILFDYNLWHLTDRDLISAYKSCDLFVLPSLAECFPTVLLEAMASKKPVVATRVGGIPEMVLDNYNGYLCEPSNSADLAMKITWLLDSSHERKRLGRNGFELVTIHYDWNKIISRILALYNSIIDSSKFCN